MNNTKETGTLQKILTAGKAEFLKKGFQSASLRNIVKEAGVTTGAFYGYYKSKEELFDALVGVQYKTLMNTYIETQEQFKKLSPMEQQRNMGEVSGECMDWMVRYVYQYKEEFQLILCSAEGTRYGQLIHEMVEIEVEATHDFMRVLQSLGRKIPKLDVQLEHILVSGMFGAFFEMIIHDMPQKEAFSYGKTLREFYAAGWTKIMEL